MKRHLLWLPLVIAACMLAVAVPSGAADDGGRGDKKGEHGDKKGEHGDKKGEHGDKKGDDDKGEHGKKQGARLVVDDDKAQCPSAQYTSIQAAVNAAPAGATILVCPGTYNESVTIAKTLRLRGPDSGSEARKQCGTAPNPVQDAIVDPPDNGSSGFTLQANDIEIRGFVVQGATGNAGIHTNKTISGYDLEDNTLRDNTFGLYANSSGAHKSNVEGNCFDANNRPGSASGNGVYSDQGLTKAEIEKNLFRRHDNAAVIFVVAAGQQATTFFTNVKIRHNDSNDDAPFIFVNLRNSQVEHNRSVKSKGSGIFFGGGSTGNRVKGNLILTCAFTGINLRTDSANYLVTTPNTDNEIKGNRVEGCGDHGIRLREGASGNVVRENKVFANGTAGDATTGNGISLENADDNTVRENKVERNRKDGIRADSASAGNTIAQNHMRANVEHDCHDDSTGPGTAGTANTWHNNRGDTENRPGLCRGATVS